MPTAHCITGHLLLDCPLFKGSKIRNKKASPNLNGDDSPLQQQNSADEAELIGDTIHGYVEEAHAGEQLLNNAGSTEGDIVGEELVISMESTDEPAALAGGQTSIPTQRRVRSESVFHDEHNNDDDDDLDFVPQQPITL